jgi:hypothetical protein
MNKIDIINRLFTDGSISQEEMEILIQNDERLKNFQVWKQWKHNPDVLLDKSKVDSIINNQW